MVDCSEPSRPGRSSSTSARILSPGVRSVTLPVTVSMATTWKFSSPPKSFPNRMVRPLFQPMSGTSRAVSCVSRRTGPVGVLPDSACTNTLPRRVPSGCATGAIHASCLPSVDTRKWPRSGWLKKSLMGMAAACWAEAGRPPPRQASAAAIGARTRTKRWTFIGRAP